MTGLLALMLLADARRTARVSHGGELVTLDEQDRGAWNRTLVIEGHALVRETDRRGRRRRGAPRAISAPGRDQRGSHRCTVRARYRLVPDRRSLRPPDRARSLPDRATQPCDRGRRTGRPRRCARRDRPTQRDPRWVPRLPRRARRPPAAGRAKRRIADRVRPSHPTRRQPRRAARISPAVATNSCGDRASASRSIRRPWKRGAPRRLSTLAQEGVHVGQPAECRV